MQKLQWLVTVDWKSDIKLWPVVIQGFLKRNWCNFVHQTVHFIFLIQMFVHNLHLHIVLQNWSRVTMIHTTLLKPWLTSDKKLTTFQTDLFISTDLFFFFRWWNTEIILFCIKSHSRFYSGPQQNLSIY